MGRVLELGKEEKLNLEGKRLFHSTEQTSGERLPWEAAAALCVLWPNSVSASAEHPAQWGHGRSAVDMGAGGCGSLCSAREVDKWEAFAVWSGRGLRGRQETHIY